MRNQHLTNRIGSPPRGLGVLPALLLPPFALLLAACSPGGADVAAAGESEADTRLLRVNAERPQPAQGYERRHVFSGRLETARTATLGFELGGRLETIFVEEGADVGPGEALARLDTARLAAARRELVAALDEARSQRALTEKTLTRLRDAFEAGGISRQQIDEAADARERAVAAVALAEARLASLDVDLDKSILRAPFAGTIARRMQDEGSVVAVGAPLLVLEETSRLRARIGVAGELVRRLAPGAPVTLRHDAGPVAATVASVLPVRDPVARTVDVLFDLGGGERQAAAASGTAGAPRAGDLVRLELAEFRPTQGYWLPLAALAEGERGLWSALVATPPAGASGAGNDNAAMAEADGYRVERRIVDVAHHAGDRVFVTGGIRASDLLVVDGTHRVVVGQRVMPREAALAAAHLEE